MPRIVDTQILVNNGFRQLSGKTRKGYRVFKRNREEVLLEFKKPSRILKTDITEYISINQDGDVMVKARQYVDNFPGGSVGYSYSYGDASGWKGSRSFCTSNGK